MSSSSLLPYTHQAHVETKEIKLFRFLLIPRYTKYKRFVERLRGKGNTTGIFFCLLKILFHKVHMYLVSSLIAQMITDLSHK